MPSHLKIKVEVSLLQVRYKRSFLMWMHYLRLILFTDNRKSLEVLG